MSAQVPSECNNVLCREAFRQRKECEHQRLCCIRCNFADEPSSSSDTCTCQKRFVVHSHNHYETRIKPMLVVSYFVVVDGFFSFFRSESGDIGDGGGEVDVDIDLTV